MSFWEEAAGLGVLWACPGLFEWQADVPNPSGCLDGLHHPGTSRFSEET